VFEFRTVKPTKPKKTLKPKKTFKNFFYKYLGFSGPDAARQRSLVFPDEVERNTCLKMSSWGLAKTNDMTQATTIIRQRRVCDAAGRLLIGRQIAR